MHRRQKKSRIGWIIVAFILLVVWLFVRQIFGNFAVHTDIVVTQGDVFSVFYKPLSSFQTFRVKWYIKHHDLATTRLEVGTYIFSGTYNPETYVNVISAGPEKAFERVTILEGRSMYDIDDYLTTKGLIQQGSYIDYVTNPTIITSLQGRYSFLQEVSYLPSLEGFLYPDTYFLDKDSNIVTSLVTVQLDTFQSRVRDIIQGDLSQFYNRIESDFPRVVFDWYSIIRLASVVEKEERILTNQPTIAGLFLHRLQIGMRLDADVTLCYGLKKPYSVCTPSYISQYISDETNPYNTRKKGGLPPQAIANIPLSTIQGVLHYKTSDYLYYLHDMQGAIHYAKDLEQHNKNKQQYLR